MQNSQNMSAAAKVIRRASTVMVLAPERALHATKDLATPYKVLFVKRSAKASFMKNIHVFPGGVVDPSDSNFESATAAAVWNFGHTSSNHPSALPADIADTVSDRLAGLREVFEECGVLIARPPASTQSATVSPHLAHVCTSLASEHEVSQARTASSNDANAFFSMCSLHGVVPDIASLLPYARWVTPPFENKRFDTWFYLCALPSPAEALSASADASEVTNLQWLSPSAALQMHADGQFAMAPPTVYVLKELAALPTIDRVLEFVHRRIERTPWELRPVHPHFNAEQVDGKKVVFSAMVGDPAYPRPHPEADSVLQVAHNDATQFPALRRHRIIKNERADGSINWTIEIDRSPPISKVATLTAHL